ncbi:MAG TPA: hypothetical protein VFQ53_16190 [Kofleriaceae bacterium]|nr:hypothetical protein [Kofleriaceae bacterium]
MSRLGFSLRLGLAPAIALAAIVGLAGCPDNPYKSSSWTKKLGTREHERAVQELEQLGDPSAIPDLGQAWLDQGKPVRDLQVIISLARPLTPAEAKAKYVTDYEEKGRDASWDKAMPFLQKALLEVDEANSRSVDSAVKAADAIGESKLPEGLDALIEIANKPLTKKLYQAQISAIRAMGKFDNEKAKASSALQKIIDREPPPHPRTAKDKETGRAMEEKFGLHLATTGAAINALGELHAPNASKTLILALYRTPELFTQIRRALVASGPGAKDELRKILNGQHAEVEQLFRDKKLDKYCGDKGDLPADQCQPVAAKEFYASVVLGDFYDPKTVPDLLNVLKKPPAPAYYVDEQAGPTQYNAVFDALRKIGAPEAAPTVRSMWMGGGGGGGKGGKKGAGAPAGGVDLPTKILAISAYAFVTRDNEGVAELGKIAADNAADDGLRQAAAEAFARLSRNPDDIKILKGLAQKYFDASAKKRAEADGKPKQDADAADKVFAEAKKINDEAKANVLRVTRDTTKTAADIKAATKAAKDAEDKFKEAKKKHRDATQPYRGADSAAKAYKGYARMFQMHIARIEVAIRCKDDIKCYAATLSMKPDDSAKNLGPYIEDLKDWTADEKLGLLEGNIERAMLEIGKKGAAASSLTDLLLDNAKSDNRLIRQSILLALPKIAAIPCSNCEAKLDAAIKAGEGKTTLGELNLETTMLRHYFSWAGGKTPSAPSTAPADSPTPTPTKSDAPAEKDDDKADDKKADGKKPADDKKAAPPAKAPAKKKGK